MRINEIFPFTGRLISLMCTSFIPTSTVGNKKSRMYQAVVVFVIPCRSHLFLALFKSRNWDLLHPVRELHFLLPAAEI